MGKSVDYLFKEITNSLNDFIEDNQSFYTFRDEINKTDARYSMSTRYVNRNIDLTWVDRIEDCVIALDTILRAPRNFIKDVEEIVPIAMTRKITSESVKHLATHTNFIQSVEDDKVTPNKILNIYKEESFATYENRFIKTLLNHLELFVEKRFQGLMSQKDVDNVSAARCEQDFELGNEKIKYSMEISVHIASEVSEEGLKSTTKSSMANDIERVMKVRTIIRDFMSSNFMSLLSDAPEVHPPITKTNLLTKNVDYKKALELWQFIESYTENGYQVDLVDNASVAIPEYQERMNELAFIEYLFLKKYTGQEVDELIREALEKQLRQLGREDELNGPGAGDFNNGKFNEENRGAIRKEFRSILGNYQDNLDEVKNIFVQEFERQERAIKKEEKRLVDAIRRIIAKQKLIEEKERLRRLEEERKAKLREEKARKKEEEAKRKAEEKAKREEERRLKKEEEARRKAEEKAKREEEKKQKALEEAKRKAEEKAKRKEEEANTPFDKFDAARKAVSKAIKKVGGDENSEESPKPTKAKPKKERKPKEDKPIEEPKTEEPIVRPVDEKTEPQDEAKPVENTPVDETPKEPIEEPQPEEPQVEPIAEENPVDETQPDDVPQEEAPEEPQKEEIPEEAPVEEVQPEETKEEPKEEKEIKPTPRVPLILPKPRIKVKPKSEAQKKESEIKKAEAKVEKLEKINDVVNKINNLNNAHNRTYSKRELDKFALARKAVNKAVKTTKSKAQEELSHAKKDLAKAKAEKEAIERKNNN